MKTKRNIYLSIASVLVAVAAMVTLNVTGATIKAESRDCADDTIIRCGALSTSELLQKYDQNATGDIQAVYTHYGISRSDLTGSTSQIKTGTVYRDGRVVVDGKTVATNAYSVSRLRFSSASRAVTIAGKTFYEGPDMSIFVRDVQAYVFMRNGQFYRAVLMSCGNPLMATPVKPPVQPVYSCDSLKAEKIDRTQFKFTSAATAKNGAEIINYTYDFGDGKTATNDSSTTHTYSKPGTYTVKVTVNVKVGGQTKAVTSDKCKVTVTVEAVPVTPTYTCDSLKATKIDRTKFSFTAAATAKNGASIAHYTYDFGDGKSTTTNSTTVEHTYAAPGTYTAKVTVNVSVNGVRKDVTSSNCKVTVTVEEVPVTPVYSCDSLKATKIDRTHFNFTTAATAKNGAEIVNYTYNFGDNHTQTVTGTTVSHTYEMPGTYTVTVAVNVKVNGVTKAVTSANCKTTVVVESVPVTPTYACEDLKAEKISRTNFKFTASASAANGAEIVSYNYDFGDNQKQTVNSTSVTHTYAQPGTYTVKVTVNVKVNGETKVVSGSNCQTTIKVENVPVTPTYVCESLQVSKIDRTRFSFTTHASAENGAEILNYTYNFGDNHSLTVNDSSVTHTYTQAGTYHVTVSVNVRVNGETKVITGENCQTTVTVENVPVTPLYACDSLSASLIQNKARTYAYTLSYTAVNGASLNKVVYNFGDNNSATYSAAEAAHVEHTYAAAGTYKTTATLYFDVTEGETSVAKTVNCETSVTISPEMCTMPGKENFPKNSSECSEQPEVCTVPGKENLPKNSPLCVVTPTTPPELPQTGLTSAVLGGGLGLSSITAAGYCWVASRKNLLNALLNR